ncbi:hypothetical protein [Bacteroides caecimuris]|uniref:Uncharacterized protein n=1 Tax=Bacteroides caecimuris TaxID=1796613 RepID=A0A3A9B9L3_9BACE|nr:hypothetical protein [Bacteroides caecimuris]NDO60426.1 hypothetical protein [Bacteroides caecimuris]TGY38843.1 hypothetical protein E5353_05930 [Bacteroides caecimuris]
MKNKVIFSLLSVLFLSSCNEELAEMKDEFSNAQESSLIAYPMKKAKTRSLSSNDQNWENWDYIVLASGEKVYSPWNRTYVGTAIPIDIRQDVKAVNGWNLIAYTVNGYGEKGMNYLVFHNKYSGILKFFYYLESGQSFLQNTAIWKLHFETPQSCLAFSNSYGRYQTDKNIEDIYLGNISNDDSKGYTLGWNCFQVELSYDPDLIEGTLQVIPLSMTTSNIYLSGITDSETTGLVISATHSNIYKNGVKTVANFAGEKAEKWVKKNVDKGAFKTVSSLVIKGAGSLVSSGISSLLGSFVGGFNKEQQTVQSVQLRTNGTVTLDGKITSLQSGIIPPFTFSISQNDVGKLGVWCMKKAPVLKLKPYAIHEGRHSFDPYVQVYTISAPSFYQTDLDADLVLNPELKSQVRDIKYNWRIYEVDSIVRRNAFNQILGSYGGVMRNNRHLYHLYADLYDPFSRLWADIRLKDKNGEVLENYEKNAPLEIFLPNAPDGTPGALPNYTFNSPYILNLSVQIETNQGNTVVSSHTFIPHIIWEYEEFKNGLYEFFYPSVPIEPIIQ